MSRPSLNRRLESEGGRVRQIADEVRCALARRWLADTELPVGRIAAILDCAYASAFNHGFEHWHAAATLAQEVRRSARPGRFFGAVGVIYANGIFARGVRQMRFFDAKSGPGANLFLMLGLFP